MQRTFQKKLQNNQYWVHGKHSAMAVLNNPKRIIKKILVTNQTQPLIPQKLLHMVEIHDIKSIANTLQHHESFTQGIAILTEPLDQPPLQEFLQTTKTSLIVLLDQLSDPQNIGAIFRSATAFNAGAVITSYDNAPKETASLVRAASGSFELTPFIKVVNLSQAITLLKDTGYWVIGLDGHASQNLDDPLPDYDKVALILGSEENGIRNLTKKNCDILVKIRTNHCVESLNVSNAAAVALYEISSKLSLEQ